MLFKSILLLVSSQLHVSALQSVILTLWFLQWCKCYWSVYACGDWDLSLYTSLFLIYHLIYRELKNYCGPGSSVGIATSYGLDGPGDRIQVGAEIFRTCPYRPWGPHSLLYNGYRVFPGGKERPRRDADPSPTSSAVDNERVELYPYSPLWVVRPVQSLSTWTRVNFTL